VYGILNQGVAAEQIRAWQQLARQDDRVRQARAGHPTASRGWWRRRRGAWPTRPLPGQPGVAAQPAVPAEVPAAVAGERAAAAGRHPAAARPRRATVSQPSASQPAAGAGEHVPTGRRAA